MNKRAVLSIFLAVMTTFILIYAFIVLGNVGQVNDTFVGMHAVKLGRLYQIGEDARFFVDNAGHYSKDQALYEFERNGLFPECGEMETYFLWKNQSRECYPSPGSISFGIRSAFASKINSYLENYKLYDLALEYYTPADLGFEEGVLSGYPFQSLVISEEPFYSVSQSFSVRYDYPFDYGEIEKHLRQMNEKCRDEERMELDRCVRSEVDRINELEAAKSREWILGGCESGDEHVLNAFAESYNDCASSHDYGCDCPSAPYDLRIKIQGQVAVLGNHSSLLGLPLNAPSIVPGARLVKQKNFIGLGLSGATNPVCRSDRRMFKLCVRQPFRVRIDSEERQLVTRFAFYIDDESAPEPVAVSEVEGKGYQWEPSRSPDVREYRAYVFKKGLVPDYSSYETVQRAGNKDETLFLAKNPKEFDIEVVSVDYEENCIISGKKQKCR